MAKEEEEMAKGQRYERGVRRRSYKALPPPFRIRGFLGNRSRDLRFSELSAIAWWAVTWAFTQTVASIADLSPQSVTARRIFADLSANRYGSVITTVQPLLRYFLYGFDFSKISYCGSGTASALHLSSSPHW